MLEQMLSWHALDLQIESRSMGIRLSDPARTPTLTSRHWQCKIQGVHLFSVGSTPTLVQALSIALWACIRCFSSYGRWKTWHQKTKPRLFHPTTHSQSVQVLKLYDTDILRSRSTNCITGLEFRVGIAPTLTLRNIRSIRSVGKNYWRIFMKVR